ncbi:MAG: twin-arginine translocase TatA/TatE family subunit [Candidatus Aadella gelida]|nr:twin-arginine translocase TatA/TatE family subunit [Candidatus Aadella gelida]
MLGLGLPEILLILVIALLIFGAAKLPEIGKALGKALSEFKKGTQEFNDNNKEDGSKSG